MRCWECNKKRNPEDRLRPRHNLHHNHASQKRQPPKMTRVRTKNAAMAAPWRSATTDKTNVQIAAYTSNIIHYE